MTEERLSSRRVKCVGEKKKFVTSYETMYYSVT